MDAAQISVLASSTVAIAAIGATWLQHRASLKNQRSLADLDNVRGVLDDCAAALHQIAYSLDDLRTQITQHKPVTFFDTEQGTDLYRQIEGDGKNLDAHLESLAVRLGREHEVSKALSATDGALLKIYRAIGLLRLEDVGDGSEYSRAQVREFELEQVEVIAINRERFDQAREWFISAAQRLAGARLD